MIKKYGIGILDELEVKKFVTYKPARFDLEILIQHYKQEIKNLTHRISSI